MNKAKLGLWILTATLFLSGTKSEEGSQLKLTFLEGYQIETLGSLNTSFEGVMEFETEIEETSKGISVSTLKLRLVHSDSSISDTLEFLIAKENRTTLLPKGRYDVVGRDKGFLNYFDGVFGVANINALGEQPLFAKRGRIQIDFLDENSVKGTLNVKLKSSGGKSIHVRGNFITGKSFNQNNR